MRLGKVIKRSEVETRTYEREEGKMNNIPGEPREVKVGWTSSE